VYLYILIGIFYILRRFVMKNVLKAFGIIAIAAVIGFSMAACKDSDDGGPLIFTSVDSSLNVYELNIASSGSSPVKDDAYVLTITPKRGSIETSKGTVSGVSGTVFSLMSGTVVFTVTVANDTMTQINGTIPLTDGKTRTAPGTVTPVKEGGNGELDGTWKKGSMSVTFNGDSFSYTGSGGTYPGTALYGNGVLVTRGKYNGDEWVVSGRYTVSGKSMTFAGFETMDYDGVWTKN
jgi:hypothetical protein